MITYQIVDYFPFIIQLIISTSVIALFVAILIDFSLYSRSISVKKEKKSIVETGTMTLFFILIYMIIISRKGILPINSVLIKQILMILGTFAIVCGCIMNIIGRFHLGKNWANQIKIYSEHKLIVHGMYRVVRHPLYASIMLMFYGACLVYRNILCFIAVTFIFIPFMYYRAKQEEILLSQEFPEYQNYKKATGMFFPKIIKKRG